MYFRNNYRKNNFPRRKFQKNFRRIKAYDPSELISKNIQLDTEEKTYQAINSFNDFPINDVLKKNIHRRGYLTPTSIQDQAIPLILEHKDLIGIANTGTGKTAAFLIPLINQVISDRNKKVLIITPTRELAVQIKHELAELARGLNLNSATLIGGINIRTQTEELRRNPNFVIGTPGRMKDLVMQKKLQLSHFRIIVLDEADQMVDIGFIDHVKYLISLLANNRQSLFFSATINEKVKQILSGFVRNPVTVSVKKNDLLKNIKHEVIRTPDIDKKIEKLHDLLNNKEFEKVLIFGRTKWGIQKLSDELINRGFKTAAIHGNKSQYQRLRILEQFKRDEIRILLATDIASRGLDIRGITHVINYDPPESYEAYIHRVGRTGRADKNGKAITFL